MAFRLPDNLKYAPHAAVALALPLVAAYEGVRYHVYKDPVGILSYCYGETTNPDLNHTYTPAECQEQLTDRVGEFAAQVNGLIAIPQPPSRIAALTSFAYNAGLSNFAHSTLLKKLNAGDVVGACNELPRWVYAQGQKLPGLVKRREAERQLCLQGVK